MKRSTLMASALPFVLAWGCGKKSPPAGGAETPAPDPSASIPVPTDEPPPPLAIQTPLYNLEAAQKAYDEANWLLAREILHEACAARPMNADCWDLLEKVEKEATAAAGKQYQRARVFLQINNYSDARDSCRHAMKLNPSPEDLVHQKCQELLLELDRKQSP